MAWGGNDRGPTLNAVTWVLTGLCILTTVLRVVSRTLFTKNYGLDDGLIVLALLVNIVYAIAISVSVGKGYGMHLLDVPKPNLVEASHSIIILGSIGVWTYALPKLGIIALLSRLLSLSKRTAAIGWTLAISSVLISLLLSVFWIVQCSPRAHQWNPMIPGTCWNPSIVENLSYFSVAYSILIDIAFAVFPLFIIARLKMALRKRIVISLTLSGGIIAAMCALYKITLVKEVDSAAGHKDATFTTVPIILFTMVEASILILIACLPTIGPFVRYVNDTASKLYSRSRHTEMTPAYKQFEGDKSSQRPHRKRGLWTGAMTNSDDGGSEHDNVGLVGVAKNSNDAENKPADVESKPADVFADPPRDPASQRTQPRLGAHEILRKVDVSSEQSARRDNERDSRGVGVAVGA